MGGLPPIFLSNQPTAIMKAKHPWIAALLFALTGTSLAQTVPGAPITGLAPAERSLNAPRITAAQAPDQARAILKTEPIPSGLGFLVYEGGWFNPFFHPGMRPPYDLYGWHAKQPAHVSQ